LLLLILAFLFTGYSISGQFGLGRVMEEKEALALHKMLHWPLIVLVLVHAAPAVYLAFVRWGWFKRRHKP
jgi:cytochrome b561